MKSKSAVGIKSQSCHFMKSKSAAGIKLNIGDKVNAQSVIVKRCLKDISKLTKSNFVKGQYI